jgi:hypothetical protein
MHTAKNEGLHVSDGTDRIASLNVKRPLSIAGYTQTITRRQ